MLNFVKGFLCIYLHDHVHVFFILLIWCIALTDFLTLNSTYIPRMNPTVESFNVLLDSACQKGILIYKNIHISVMVLCNLY